MADTVKFNDDEMSALWGLPWMAQIIYMRALRPNMNYETGVSGRPSRVTKALSFQAVRECIEVHPARGRKAYSHPSVGELRSALAVLVKAGLIVDACMAGERFVFKCVLADTDKSIQIKDSTTTTQSSAQLQHETQHDDHGDNASINAGLDDIETAKTTQPEAEKQHSPSAKDNTPPEPLPINTTTAGRRARSFISSDFSIDDDVRARLFRAGVPIEVAEFFLQEFIAEQEHIGQMSSSWAAKLVTYCKKWRWRYEKDRPKADGGEHQSAPSRAGSAHERDKALYEAALAEELGDSDIHSAKGEVRTQVVIPYRKR